MLCKKCGKVIPSDSLFCPSCGYAVEQAQPETIIPSDATLGETNNAPPKGSNGKIKSQIPRWNPFVRIMLSVVLVIVSIVCMLQSIDELISDKYAFYTDHYEACMDGYEDCMDSAKDAGYYFQSTYERLAEDYKEMANDALTEIWGMRIKAIILVVVAVICVLFAYKVSFKKPRVSLQKTNENNIERG